MCGDRNERRRRGHRHLVAGDQQQCSGEVKRVRDAGDCGGCDERRGGVVLGHLGATKTLVIGSTELGRKQAGEHLELGHGGWPPPHTRAKKDSSHGSSRQRRCWAKGPVRDGVPRLGGSYELYTVGF